MTKLRQIGVPCRVIYSAVKLSMLAGIAGNLAPSAAAQDIVSVSPAVLAELDMALVASQPMIAESGAATEAQISIAVLAEPASLTQAPLTDVVGPQMNNTAVSVDTTGDEEAAALSRGYASFGEDLNAIKWETLAVYGYYTAINAPKLFKDPTWPKTQKEGWFGRDTNNLGVDKLAHAYSTYVVSEILHARLRRKTGDAPGIELTSAALASGAMLWAELFDSIEPDSGWSWEDVAFNSIGAGFSVLRNAVPGLDRKLDFRLMIVPNEDIYTLSGKEHFRQQRHFLALKPAGFKGMERNPLRFVEFHLGYRADDFLNEDRAAGITPKRHVFVGLGLNLREVFFKQPRSRVGRAVGDALDYFQPPYTVIQHDITE